MRTRKLGRWIGRLAAVAAFGVGATFGVTAVVAAAVEFAPAGASATQIPADEPAPNDYSWE